MIEERVGEIEEQLEVVTAVLEKAIEHIGKLDGLVIDIVDVVNKMVAAAENKSSEELVAAENKSSEEWWFRRG